MTELEVLEVLVRAMREHRLVSLKINGRARTALPCVVGGTASGERALLAFERRAKQRRPTLSEWHVYSLGSIESVAISPFPSERVPLELEWHLNEFRTVVERIQP